MSVRRPIFPFVSLELLESPSAETAAQSHMKVRALNDKAHDKVAPTHVKDTTWTNRTACDIRLNAILTGVLFFFGRSFLRDHDYCRFKGMDQHHV